MTAETDRARDATGVRRANLPPRTMNFKFYNYGSNIDSFEELQVKKALEIFNKSRENSNLHDDVLVFYKGDPKNIKEDFGELHISDELPQ